MARITVEDCQRRVDNRFLLVQMAIKRVHQYREGYEPLVESKNKEVVTALREIVFTPPWKKAHPPFWMTSPATAGASGAGTTAAS